MKKLFKDTIINIIMAILFICISCYDAACNNIPGCIMDCMIVIFNFIFVVICGVGTIIDKLDEIKETQNKLLKNEKE